MIARRKNIFEKDMVSF